MIFVRFDRIVTLWDQEADEVGFVGAKLPQVPNVGEIVNLLGNPYMVYSRKWAVYDWTESLYVYLRMLPAVGN